MVFLVLAIACVVIGVRQYKSIPIGCSVKNSSLWKKGIISLACFLFAIAFLIPSLFGGIEGEEHIIKSSNMVGARQGESIYVFLDEEGNTYYINGNKVEVNSNFSPNYIINIGDYEKPYVQGCRTEVKMTLWALGLVDRIEYKIYIPENMPIE